MMGLVANRDLKLEIILWNLKQLKAKLGETEKAIQGLDTKIFGVVQSTPTLTWQDHEQFTTSMDQTTKEIQALTDHIDHISLEEVEKKISHYCGGLNGIPFNMQLISLG